MTSTLISIISVAVAFVALILSWRAQRTHGRLQAVEIAHRDKQKQIGLGFRVRNGPNELTITGAVINMVYKVNKQHAVLWNDERFTFAVQSDEFEILGITGPEFGFRLEPFDEAEWRFPFFISYYLPKISAESADADADAGPNDKRHQIIELTYTVTASGKTKSSEPEKLGAYVENKTLFGYRTRGRASISLQSTILSVLAHGALLSIRSASLPAPGWVKDLAYRGLDLPAGLEEWLVHAWERAGSFSDESTEILARMLVKLRPPRPDPELLARVTSWEGPPSTVPWLT